MTGSMQDWTANQGSTKRCDMAHRIVKGIVEELTKLDSAAQKKVEEEGGGIKTTLFAKDNVRDFGDLNPSNIESKWQTIHWGGQVLL